MRFQVSRLLLALIASALALSGCDNFDEIDDSAGDDSAPIEISGLPPGMEEGEHGHEGPRGGYVIELGRNHKFHAELVEDEQSQAVRVFILDGDLNDLPIDATTLVLNLTTGSKTVTFDLATANPGRKSAEFLSTDAALLASLHAEGTTAKLRAAIQGATYVGTLNHEACACDHEH